MGRRTAKRVVGLSYTPRKAKNEMPYAYAFGFEAIIPLEVGLTTIQTETYDINYNAEVLAQDLNLANERRESALIWR